METAKGSEGESPERNERILRERALRLAREPEEGDEAERLEVVEFLLGRERYGVETIFVREVHPLREVIPLPCTPPFVAGIMNLRGEILSVIDLRVVFDMERRDATEQNKVIVLRGAAMEFGILVDLLVGAHGIAAGDVQPPPASPAGASREYRKGVTADRLVLLDAEKMLADRRLVVHEEV